MADSFEVEWKRTAFEYADNLQAGHPGIPQKGSMCDCSGC